MEKLRPATQSQAVYWYKTHPELGKAQCGGYSKGISGSAGGGGIIRDHIDDMSHSLVDSYEQCSNNIAEAMAIWKGVNICKDDGISFWWWNLTHYCLSTCSMGSKTNKATYPGH